MKHIFVTIVALILPSVGYAGTVAITSCGQSINGRGELVADLDCSGYAGTTVSIVRGRLVLNGFTLTGNPNNTVVSCAKNCRVLGPGTITGGRHGITAPDGTIRISEVTLIGNAGAAATANAVLAKDCTVTGNGSVNDPAFFALSGGLHGGRRVIIRNTVVDNNLNWGILTATALVGSFSSVQGNGTNPDCLSSPFVISLGCADLATSHWRIGPFVAASSVCGTSQRVLEPPGNNWGVCTND